MNKDLEIAVIVMDNRDHVFFQNTFILIKEQHRKKKKNSQGKQQSGDF